LLTDPERLGALLTDPDFPASPPRESGPPRLCPSSEGRARRGGSVVVVVVGVGHPEGCTWAWRRMARRRVTLGRTLRDVSGAPVTGSVLRARRGAARRGGAAHRSAPIPPPAVDGNGGWPGKGGEWTVEWG
jgi:hypothetical protein